MTPSARTTGFRLLACDLDGTLLDAEGRMPERVAAFLGRVRAAGVHVVAATGRRFTSARPLVQKAGLQGPCVVQNGAVVVDIESGEKCAGFFVREAAAAAAVRDLKERGFGPMVYSFIPEGRTDRGAECTIEKDAADPTGYLKWYRDYARFGLNVVDDLEAVEFADITRIVTHDTRERLEELMAAPKPPECAGLRRFIGYDQAHSIHRFEVMNQSATKWSGVQVVAASLEVEPAAILAVGDDTNDCEMLAEAGHSLAAPAATEAALAAAREWVVCREGEDPIDAVLRALAEHLGL